MVIALTPDIEQALHELAEKQGTTVEFLALKTLRDRLFTAKPQPVTQPSKRRHVPKTLADFWAGWRRLLFREFQRLIPETTYIFMQRHRLINGAIPFCTAMHDTKGVFSWFDRLTTNGIFYFATTLL